MMRLLRCLMPRSGFRTFILGLVGFYLFLVFSFHAGLQGSGSSNGVSAPRGQRDMKGKIQQQMFDDIRKSELGKQDHKEEKLSPKQLKKYNDRKPINILGENDIEVRQSHAVTTRKPREVIVEKPHRTPSQACSGEEVDEFVFRPLGDDVVLFSAYWDERPNDFDNKENGTLIRVMAISKRGAKPNLQCVFPAQQVHGREETSSVSFYEMCENHGRPWGAYILSCRVPGTVTSPMCSVTLQVPSSKWLGKDSPAQAAVTIRTTKPAGQPNDFATCVPPLFGKVGQYQLTEFIEVTQMLGSQHITFYDYNVEDSTRAVLKHYQAKGLVSIIPWTLPAHINNAMWYYGQLLAIQDCMYRNMHSAAYVSFNDIDEYMVPHAPDLHDWADMVKHLAAPKRVGFSFISAFFDPYQTGGEGKNPKYENFTVLSSVQRTSSFSGIRTKCMVQPYQIFEKGIHHVSKPIFADLQVTKIGDKDAFLHHYRKCVANFGMDCGRFTKDTSLLRFADVVYAGVQDTILALLTDM